jgi:hypothetical protein
MSEKVQLAYRDLGNSLHKKSIDEFYKTEGWDIVKHASFYTQNAFTCCFDNLACLEYWQKYLILPKKTPFLSKEDLKKLEMPVYILANKNDLCHPFDYGIYMREHIKDAYFEEILDKDSDEKGHRDAVNIVINKMIFV